MKKMMVLAMLAALQPSALLAQDNQAATVSATVAAPTTAPIATTAPLPGQSAAAELPPVDPARLERANRVAAQMLPEGSYQTMVETTFRTLADNLMPMMMSIGRANSRKETKMDRMLANPGAASRNPMDPAMMRHILAIVAEEMAPAISELEPGLRAGLAQTLARRFDEQQLRAVETFFRTPAGGVYARQSLELLTDPAMLQANLQILPRLMDHMPAISRRVRDEVGDPNQRRRSNTNGLAVLKGMED